MDDLILVGRLGGIHGIKGFLELIEISDNPDRFGVGHGYLTSDDELLICSEYKAGGKKTLIRFKNYETSQEARALCGESLFITRDRLGKIAEDEFYSFELEGMTLVAENGADLGVVISIEELPQGLLLRDSEDLFPFGIPFLHHFIQGVDREGKRIFLQHEEELYEEEEKK